MLFGWTVTSSEPPWTGEAEGHQQDQRVPAQIAVWKHQAALEQRGSGGLRGGTSVRHSHNSRKHHKGHNLHDLYGAVPTAPIIVF